MLTDTQAILDPSDPKERLIVALDFPSAAPARTFLTQLGGTCRWLKVGMELYYAEGNSFVQELRTLGYEVFLDLKFHDIPNTVAGAIRSASTAGATLLTLHAAGGAVMMEAAAHAASQLSASPRLLAVTVLTSMDSAQLAGIGITDTPADQVLRLAKLAWASGIRGMVCSAEEVALLRSTLGPSAELVVPGIRPAGTAIGDQKRVASPADAIRRGASRLVVGRPITHAAAPQAAAEAILAEIASAL
ncbi:orotidine-5'-phosphate decarboxylase [Granulicella arctica]|uniref:orotidine-5'-phosphate decarboxylase n=1 Tax=Granulicella arctica TaxID=940613 RepID=UPI0021DFCE8E|nr:orotidine-5'-phosphate decarboxylase [Granulicella arctica]